MATKTHILVVNDDKQSGQGLVTQLEEAGYTTSVAAGTKSALDKLREARPDAILLDLTPKTADDEFLQTLRGDGDYASSAPVIVMAPKGSESEAVSAISVGADDFLVKPVRAPELTARLQIAMLKNTARESPSHAVALRAGPIFLNADRREVYLRFENGEIRPVSLTKREFGLLRALMARKKPDDVAPPTCGRSFWRRRAGRSAQSGRLYSPFARKSRAGSSESTPHCY
jgi:DNA-binding response OmpR family regulator